ncbi:MIP/aquaporin family protein [Neobacillus dielmonensis]|uniref:MIP/aquaporin family protein n=1 Tax=Neobacillus dielmonensis TaxID=1347369 RepID=UPI0005A6DF4A|nr:MIP/aquaporin family protein [Neobacillus dielmonensis]
MDSSPSLWKRSTAEGIGTALLVFIGPGAAAFNGILAANNSQGTTLADIGVISLAFAIVVIAMIYTIGKISGCHINPAVTIGLAVIGQFPKREVLPYLIGQLVGAVIGAIGILVVLGSDGATIGNLGATTLSPSTGYLQGIVIEAMETFILMLVIMGMAVDHRAPKDFAGLIIGLTVGGIIMMTAGATGSSFNPARTFGPYLVGSFSGGNIPWNQFPIYVIGPVIGSSLAAFVYRWIASPNPLTAAASQNETTKA